MSEELTNPPAPIPGLAPIPAAATPGATPADAATPAASAIPGAAAATETPVPAAESTVETPTAEEAALLALQEANPELFEELVKLQEEKEKPATASATPPAAAAPIVAAEPNLTQLEQEQTLFISETERVINANIAQATAALNRAGADLAECDKQLNSLVGQSDFNTPAIQQVYQHILSNRTAIYQGGMRWQQWMEAQGAEKQLLATVQQHMTIIPQLKPFQQDYMALIKSGVIQPTETIQGRVNKVNAYRISQGKPAMGRSEKAGTGNDLQRQQIEAVPGVSAPAKPTVAQLLAKVRAMKGAIPTGTSSSAGGGAPAAGTIDKSKFPSSMAAAMEYKI